MGSSVVAVKGQVVGLLNGGLSLGKDDEIEW
jgi:hypothetical protein